MGTVVAEGESGAATRGKLETARGARRGGWATMMLVAAGAGTVTTVFGMGFPAMILAPLLYGWLRVVHGGVGTLWGLALGLGVAGAAGSVEGLLAAVVWGLTGALLGWGSQQGWPARRIVILAASPVAVLSVLQFSALARQEPRAAFLSELEAVVGEAARLQSTLGTGPAEVERARQLATGLGEFLWLLTPAMGLVSAVVVCYIVYRLALWIFPRFGFALVPIAPFRTWALSEKFAWVLILGLGLEVLRVRWATAVGHNVLVVASMAYMVQGGSVLSYLLETRRVPKVGQVAIWILGLVFLQPLSGLVAIVTGFADTWVNFRRRLGPHRA